MSSNLPPDIQDSDIPGNRPEDEAWERFVETDPLSLGPNNDYSDLTPAQQVRLENLFEEWYYVRDEYDERDMDWTADPV